MAHLVKQQPNAPPPPAIPAHMEREMRKSGFVVPQVTLAYLTYPEPYRRQPQSVRPQP